MHYLIYFFSALLISMLITYSVNILFRKYNVYDIPCERSSHHIPTPRSGGLGIVLSWLIILVLSGKLNYIYFFPIIIAVIGFIDDLKSLPIIVRFSIQAIISLIVILFGISFESINIPIFGNFNLGILSIPLTLLWFVSITNIYNFMDGIDGLAGGVGFIIAVFMTYIAWKYGQIDILLCSIILAGGILGFTFFNFPPAKIFMGDTGSTFLGFLFAILSVKLSNNGINLLAIIILFGAFIFDTTVTLIRRILKGEKWFMSHRTHFYQRLLKLGYSHFTVTIGEYIITLILGLLSLGYLQVHDSLKIIFLFLSFCLLAGNALWITYMEKKKGIL
ncbi:MAG: glycosyltransferase family 4 protein, partial [Candidatus Firestonebacteria bacterium]|nr:glycosyltransferase family 4 protein [Candidatus Firestonebacteria bacterium]